MDFPVEMSRRELDVSLEIREEIVAGFGCDQSTTVLNARDASQRNINYRGEQITAANVQEECHVRRLRPPVVTLVLLVSSWGTTNRNHKASQGVLGVKNPPANAGDC